MTSNPSPQYVERVARKFDNDGSGRRGNLAAVVKALLLDAEARAAPASATAGKLKEPLLRLTQLWRAFDASSQSGKYNVQNITGLIGQGPLQAPSVFNFFSPFYAPPGEIANQGLVAPEMQVDDGVPVEPVDRLCLRARVLLHDDADSRLSARTGCAATRPRHHRRRADERALAGNPQALVDAIADRLVGGPDLDHAQHAGTAAWSSVHPPSESALRVAEALYLIASAPEIALQR